MKYKIIPGNARSTTYLQPKTLKGQFNKLKNDIFILTHHSYLICKVHAFLQISVLVSHPEIIQMFITRYESIARFNLD